MKKIKVLLLVGMMLLSVAIIGCKKKNTSLIINLKSDNDLLAFYSLSSAKILSTNASLERNVRAKQGAEIGENDIDMNAVNEYMQMMESMFSEKAPTIIKTETSDRPEYETKIIFEATDLSGNKDIYVLYYNQIEQIELDEDENEIEYTLNGIAIIGETEYQLKGEREVEEGEESLDIVVKLDEKNYVIIEQEVENGEQEYEYEIIKDGKKYKSISFEVENGKEFEAEFITNKNGTKEKYRFYKDGNVVKIKYQSNEKVLIIKATAFKNPETGEVTYTYKVSESNQEYNFKK